MEVYRNGVIGIESTDSIKPLKLILYYDSLDCYSCRIALLMDIEDIYDYSLMDGGFAIMTIFSPRADDIENVKIKLMQSKISFPVYIDAYKEFSSLNNTIPSERPFHVFLINENGKPLYIGNPLGNDKLKDFFEDLLDTEFNDIPNVNMNGF